MGTVGRQRGNSGGTAGGTAGGQWGTVGGSGGQQGTVVGTAGGQCGGTAGGLRGHARPRRTCAQRPNPTTLRTTGRSRAWRTKAMGARVWNSRARTHTSRRTDAHIYILHTQAHRHTDKHTHTHTPSQAHTHTRTHTHTWFPRKFPVVFPLGRRAGAHHTKD